MGVWLPAALQYGIAYETFWQINPKIMSIYQESRKRALEEKEQMMDYEAWLHGQYHMMSIGAAMSKKVKYPQRPYSLEKQGNGMKNSEEGFLLWVDEYNSRFEKSI